MTINVDNINCLRCGASEHEIGYIFTDHDVFYNYASIELKCKNCETQYRVETMEDDGTGKFSVKVFGINKEGKEVELDTRIDEIRPSIYTTKNIRIQLGEITEKEYIQEIEEEMIREFNERAAGVGV